MAGNISNSGSEHAADSSSLGRIAVLSPMPAAAQYALTGQTNKSTATDAVTVGSNIPLSRLDGKRQPDAVNGKP